MKSKLGLLLVLLIIIYVTAFFINFLPSIKYPDLNMNDINIISSIIYIFVLVLFTKKAVTENKGIKILKVYFMLGVISGLLVFMINTFEGITFEYVILDIIASIQYPIYLVFTTSLFGINMLLDVGFDLFSLVLSIFYFIMYIFVIIMKKVISKV